MVTKSDQHLQSFMKRKDKKKSFILFPLEELHNLQEEYLAGSEEEKRFLEQRFGKQMIQHAVEEAFSRKWLEENSKNCPRCGCHIQVILKS